MTTHKEQQKLWDEEHARPTMLLQMDSDLPSGGVEKFWAFLTDAGAPRARGLEMGCGKGRNVVWLARNGVEAHGFDFSPSAIKEAKRRADAAGVPNAHFLVQDATKRWDYEDASFDFALDCFASTDIESAEGRAFARAEFRRVLRPGGLLLVYVLSTDDEFHKEMILKTPAEEAHSFTHPAGKYEKVFEEKELDQLYAGFELIAAERVAKTTEFNGKPYACLHHWRVYRTPSATA